MDIATWNHNPIEQVTLAVHFSEVWIFIINLAPELPI